MVVEGRLRLRIGREAVTLEAGELQVVPADVPHAVESGIEGTLLIIDT
ncbi:cupin domain-containing protein [Frateuria sp. Soil773]|nr:cupin domain-containing protein [Frateuria sp. Soil773]